MKAKIKKSEIKKLVESVINERQRDWEEYMNTARKAHDHYGVDKFGQENDRTMNLLQAAQSNFSNKHRLGPDEYLDMNLDGYDFESPYDDYEDSYPKSDLSDYYDSITESVIRKLRGY